MSKTDTKSSKDPKAALLTAEQQTVNLEPPDGGWGWCVILGTSISLVSNVINIVLGHNCGQ